jgi:hypothetical protein
MNFEIFHPSVHLKEPKTNSQVRVPLNKEIQIARTAEWQVRE